MSFSDYQNPEHAAQVSAYAWTAGLTREEWGWVHAMADARDEAEYQAIDAEEVDLCQPR